MDLLSINVLVSLVSVVMMVAAIVYILTYVLGSFSSKSGAMSLKTVLYSLLYFFGSPIFLLMVAEWLSSLARVRTPLEGIPFHLLVGASALALNALLHVFCGFLTAIIYLRGRRNLVSTLKRVLTR